MSPFAVTLLLDKVLPEEEQRSRPTLFAVNVVLRDLESVVFASSILAKVSPEGQALQCYILAVDETEVSDASRISSGLIVMFD